MEYISPSKEELLYSIRPDMRLTRNLFKRTYGYGITNPSFQGKVMDALESVGCSRARQYYETWVSEYEAAHDAELKSTAIWLKKEYEKEWEKQQRGGEQERAIQNLTRSELTELCRRLLQEGGITEPEQFAMAVRQGR